eukprot:107212_1
MSGCESTIPQVFLIIWGVMALLVFAPCIWCLYTHIKYQKENPAPKIVYLLSISLYIFTLIASISASFLSFTVCTNIPMVLLNTTWRLSQIAWTLQWTTLIALLFARLYFVFIGSYCALSRCTINIFIIFYSSLLFLIFISVICAVFNKPNFFYVGYVLILIIGIGLSIYLPILFINKLITVSKHVNSADLTVTKKENQKKSSIFITVITKCTILTMVSVLSTWSVFFSVILMFIFGVKGFAVGAVWVTAYVMDINTHFLCIMLTNSFCDKYYGYLCGKLDKLCRSCVKAHDNEPTENKGNSKTVEELSSYIETVQSNSDV